MSTIVLVSGGFDPLHKGHLDLLQEAKKLGDHLTVGLNSDEWLTRKKGSPFMSQWDRMDLLMNLECVDHVVPFDDNDDTAKDFIEKAIASHGIDHKFIFANGGDRTEENIPEMELREKYSFANLEFVFGVGGNKTYSSSSINSVQREWGDYKVIHAEDFAKVKILTIDINKSISYQRHFYRGEIWHVMNGQAMIKTSKGKPSNYTYDYLTSGQHFSIIPYEWHQVTNMGNEPLRIIEIQHGSYVEEDDIERYDGEVVH
tara:strand:+ start:237 stop:1010 length:774 start_codon:yes stop_codon:yes gene_type:complete